MWRSRHTAAAMESPQTTAYPRQQSDPAGQVTRFSPRPWHHRWLLALLCLVVLSVHASRAAAYSCAGDFHCYGIVRWVQDPSLGQYFGVWSDILDANSVCAPGCGGGGSDGAINNEIWLMDTQTPECQTNSFGMCWIETGYNSHEQCLVPPICALFR